MLRDTKYDHKCLHDTRCLHQHQECKVEEDLGHIAFQVTCIIVKHERTYTKQIKVTW